MRLIYVMPSVTVEPFCFRTRLTLAEATGRKACSVVELLEGLREADEEVIYYHTHRFIKQFHFLVPEGANDFAYWVSNTVQADKLGEELTAIDIVRFNSLAGIKEAFVNKLERHMAENPGPQRIVAPGREFNFMRAVRFSLPTRCAATGYSSFIDCLRRVSVSSLYLHVFEARLRQPCGIDDFSLWFSEQLGDRHIGEKLSCLDPYSYTLEGLRRKIIEIVAEREAACRE